MKILIVSEHFPYPPSEGYTLEIYNLIKELSKKNEVFLLSFNDANDIKKKEMKKYCRDVHVFSKTNSGENAFMTQLNKIVTKMDIIQFESFKFYKYAPLVKDKPIILNLGDVGSLTELRNAKIVPNFLEKLKSIKWSLEKRYEEKKYLPSFDACVVYSKGDYSYLKKLAPKLKIRMIPNGVDADKFRPNHSRKDINNLIFTGNMYFRPNHDAALHFYNKIFPRVKSKIPQIKLYLVGRNPSLDLKKLCQDGVIVTGAVKKIEDYLNLCEVYVCPIRAGSGIKNKILEAMACGLAVIATPISAEGINGKPNTHFLIAKNNRDFAAKVITLIQNAKIRAKLGKNARKLMIEKYSWKKTGREFEKLYCEVKKCKKAE